jgi:hypothetical protein
LSLDAGNVKSYPGSGTTWFDKSGRGNNGTLENGPTFNSQNGGSIVFDGVNDRVNCGTFNVPYLTLSVWLYRIANGSIGICRKQLSWAMASTSFGTLQVAPGTSWAFYNTGYIIPMSTWTNITYTYKGTGGVGSQIVYANGIEVWSVTNGTGVLPSNSNPVNIGFDDNNWWWSGRISQTQIYNRALTAQEVLQNYNATKSRYNL